MKYTQKKYPGPDESHTIHKLRATTVIFEEGASFDDDGPVIANIVLPNKPHSSALQVEEVGSFQFETHERSSYQTSEDIHGIIDEIDSDGDHSISFKRSVSRNVSIVSAASEDENIIGMSSSRDVSVDEIHRDIQFDNGHAHIKFIKTVIEEQEVICEGVDEVPKQETSSATYGKTDAFTANLCQADNSLAHKLSTNDVSKKPNKSQLLDIGTIENRELTEDEQKQIRIKEIRSKARKASLVNKEEQIEKSNNAITKTVVNDIGKEPINAKILNVENALQVDSSVQSTNNTDLGKHEKSAQLNGITNEEEEIDGEMADLLKRVQAQRAALNDILLNKDQVQVTVSDATSPSLDYSQPGSYTFYSLKEIALSLIHIFNLHTLLH